MSPEKLFSFLKQNAVLLGINGIISLLFLSLVLRGGFVSDTPLRNSLPGETSEITFENPKSPDLESPLYQKPVFHADRHPALKPEAPKVAEVEIPFRLVLTGVLKVSEDLGWAFLKISGTQENHQVGLGEEIDGWRLEKLGENQAILVRDGQTRTISMDNPLTGNPQTLTTSQEDQGARPRTRKRK